MTFTITGPGTIIAVDSASMTQETFRGNVRNAYQGLAFAIVQATGPGTITVTASAAGLTERNCDGAGDGRHLRSVLGHVQLRARQRRSPRAGHASPTNQ